MSVLREHIEDLRKIATTLEQRGLSGHGNRQNSQHFQFAAVLTCAVHLDELEAMVNDRRLPADLSDTQIKALVSGSPELARLDYGEAYLLVRKIEAAANSRSLAEAQKQDDPESSRGTEK